jgi:putative peptidoglycan lipid II flippase
VSDMPAAAGPADLERPAATAAPAAPGAPAAPAAGRERSLARAATVIAVLTAAGALFGLLRDQTIARFFGAGAATDAFLVAWTVPEVAATLLIEGAMTLVLVPAFSTALARRAAGTADPALAPDPVRALIGATLPRLLLVLGTCAGLLAAGAPVVVHLLAPGLADPQLAVACTRLTALTLLGFGLAGYLRAALQAHRSFAAPAAVYVAYNIGIIATMVLLHGRLGVRAAALGVALGGVLMVLAQLPSALRRLPARTAADKRRKAARRQAGRGRTALLAGLGVVAPAAVFAFTRQSQVLAERFWASTLPPGAISHLNYAQKVAQMPMVLSLMICTVTFPMVARAVANGEAERVRRRVERDLIQSALVVLLGASFVVAYAPQIIELLFQRGAFQAADTAATASVMRVYALGLLGHSLVGVLSRPFFSGRPTWFPAAVMGAGLVLTVLAGAVAAARWGAGGIAAANALGISLTAVLLLRGIARRPPRGALRRTVRRGPGHPVTAVGIDVGRVVQGLARLTLAAAAAALAGWGASAFTTSPVVALAVGLLLVPVTFAGTAVAVRAPEVPPMLAILARRLRHAR